MVTTEGASNVIVIQLYKAKHSLVELGGVGNGIACTILIYINTKTYGLFHWSDIITIT